MDMYRISSGNIKHSTNYLKKTIKESLQKSSVYVGRKELHVQMFIQEFLFFSWRMTEAIPPFDAVVLGPMTSTLVFLAIRLLLFCQCEFRDVVHS